MLATWTTMTTACRDHHASMSILTTTATRVSTIIYIHHRLRDETPKFCSPPAAPRLQRKLEAEKAWGEPLAKQSTLSTNTRSGSPSPQDDVSLLYSTGEMENSWHNQNNPKHKQWTTSFQFSVHTVQSSTSRQKPLQCILQQRGSN